MPKRRPIRGKKLLIVTASIGAASFLGCGDDDRSRDSGLVANLVLPMDASFDSGNDAATAEGGTDAAAEDAGEPTDADVSFMDAPVANLLPPPDGSF